MPSQNNKKTRGKSDDLIIAQALREASKYAKKLAEQTGTKFIVAKPPTKKKKRAA